LHTLETDGAVTGKDGDHLRETQGQIAGADSNDGADRSEIWLGSVVPRGLKGRLGIQHGYSRRPLPGRIGVPHGARGACGEGSERTVGGVMTRHRTGGPL
jgi:hypothetical protein